MNFEKMWNQMKTEMMNESEKADCSGVRREYLESTILRMVKIETTEREWEEEHPLEYTVTQDIVSNVDIKAPLLEKSARKLFGQITGHKVIDSLEKLESEMQKRRGKGPFHNQETIVVDECVDITSDIFNEAAVHGINIARFGVDVISSDAMPKGAFIRKEVFHDRI